MLVQIISLLVRELIFPQVFVAITVCNAFVVFLMVTVSISRWKARDSDALNLTTTVQLDTTVTQGSTWDSSVGGDLESTFYSPKW